MEGGSPSLIWRRWTLPMYRAQLRYWRDHPRVATLVAAFMKVPRRYTPPPAPMQPQDKPATAVTATPVLDWSQLDQ